MTFDILKDLPFTPALTDVPLIASCHHEHLDGSGYYRGLRGEQIPLPARILTVATVFDNLTAVRHFRERTPIVKVHEQLQSQRETQLDGTVIDAFYKSPANVILEIMDSERGLPPSPRLDRFKSISWKRLIELCQGETPSAAEENLAQEFTETYSAGLKVGMIEEMLQ